jgi:hypothetical protein
VNPADFAFAQNRSPKGKFGEANDNVVAVMLNARQNDEVGLDVKHLIDPSLCSG